MPETLEGTIEQAFDDLNDYRDAESEAMGKFNQTFDALKEAIQTRQEESLNLGLCEEWNGDILHNCVFQMLLGKLGGGIAPDVYLTSLKDYRHPEELSTYPDFCHVHVNCNETEIKTEVERFTQ